MIKSIEEHYKEIKNSKLTELLSIFDLVISITNHKRNPILGCVPQLT
jgi:hypothetical protein